MANKRVLITGANSGIGFETALALAGRGAEVVMACRRDDVLSRLGERRASDAAVEICRRFPHASVQHLELDLASQRSVKASAARFLERFERLDLLINNAGVMWLPRSRTEDGFETQLAVNHLGHFTLTCLLLPALLRSPDSRIVTVSSLAHLTAELDPADMFYGRRRYVPTKVYSQSKLANLLFARELGRRLVHSGASTISVAAHPGLASTNLFVTAFPNAKRFGALFSRGTSLLAQSAANASLPTLYAATMPDVRSGDYIGPTGWFELWGKPGRARSTRAAQDLALGREVWSFSEKMTGITDGLRGTLPGQVDAPEALRDGR